MARNCGAKSKISSHITIRPIHKQEDNRISNKYEIKRSLLEQSVTQNELKKND